MDHGRFRRPQIPPRQSRRVGMAVVDGGLQGWYLIRRFRPSIRGQAAIDVLGTLAEEASRIETEDARGVFWGNWIRWSTAQEGWIITGTGAE